MGLVANMGRVRAVRIVDLASAINLAIDPSKAGAILKLAGMSDEQFDRMRGQMEFDHFKSEGAERISARFQG